MLKVKNFILEEQMIEIYPISHQGNGDILISVDPNLSVDLTDVEFIVETTEEPLANTSEEALAALAVEHQKTFDSKAWTFKSKGSPTRETDWLRFSD